MFGMGLLFGIDSQHADLKYLIFRMRVRKRLSVRCEQYRPARVPAHPRKLQERAACISATRVIDRHNPYASQDKIIYS